MSHVTWDLEVNLPIVPASQCVSREQIPGRCAPRHLLGWCHHCEPRPQRSPGAKSLFPQQSSQCCSGAQRMLLGAPDGAVNVPRGWGLTPAEPAPAAAGKRAQMCPDLGAEEGAEQLSCLL